MEEDDILVKDLEKVFINRGQKLVAIENVSFNVKRSSIFCLVGPSGCGKSTILKILLDLISPTSGEVQIKEERKKEIAYVQQHSLLFPWRTLIQNVAIGAELHESLNKDIIDRLLGQIRLYKLNGFEDKFPNELSGGMKQRADIIRAIESRPALLFCDEPFSAIDFVTRLELTSQFKHRCHIEQMTTVFITHNIEEAIFLGDTVAVMSGRPGRIIATYKPNLRNNYDAIACRETAEFQQIFREISSSLKQNHAKQN